MHLLTLSIQSKAFYFKLYLIPKPSRSALIARCSVHMKSGFNIIVQKFEVHDRRKETRIEGRNKEMKIDTE